MVDVFRAAVLATGNSASWTGFGTQHVRMGGLPAPFDAVASSRLVGPSGSHPLAAIAMDELVRRSTDGLDAEITLNQPIRIGEALSGHLRVTARKQINARGASFRLVGLLLTEHQRSEEERDAKGNVTRSDSWVEVETQKFDDLTFTETPLPTSLAPGQSYETDFTFPAPRLGPPSAHMGTAVLAWALDAQWNIAMGGDEHVATIVPVMQNIDYLRSGAVRLAEGAMFDAWQVGDASIAVAPLPPVAAGSEIDVTVNWPGAGAGRGGRLELQADVQAPNGVSGLVLWSTVVDPQAFRSGATFKVPVPPDAPPTLSDKGVGVSYRIRALVDRQFRSDLAVERAIAVM